MTIVLVSKQTKLNLAKPAGTTLLQNSTISNNLSWFCTVSSKGIPLSMLDLFPIHSNTKEGLENPFYVTKIRGFSLPSVCTEDSVTPCAVQRTPHTLHGLRDRSLPQHRSPKPICSTGNTWAPPAHTLQSSTFLLRTPYTDQVVQPLQRKCPLVSMLKYMKNEPYTTSEIIDIHRKRLWECSPQNSSPKHRLYWT